MVVNAGSNRLSLPLQCTTAGSVLRGDEIYGTAPGVPLPQLSYEPRLSVPLTEPPETHSELTLPVHSKYLFQDSLNLDDGVTLLLPHPYASH